MPRENSFSDEDGRSLTPDLELPEIGAPNPPVNGQPTIISTTKQRFTTDTRSSTGPTSTGDKTPKDKFRASVRKIIQLHRASTVFASNTGVGAEPGIDPRRDSAYLTYGHIRCVFLPLFTLRPKFHHLLGKNVKSM
jgi:hypothetical protein